MAKNIIGGAVNRPFRIWYPEETRMIYGGMMNFDMSDGEWMWEGRHGSFHSRYNPKPILMKGTGILIMDEKIGELRQLFQGDLITLKGTDLVIEIVWDERFAGFDWQVAGTEQRGEIYSDWDWKELCYDHLDRIIHLGNIYENPELLNK